MMKPDRVFLDFGAPDSGRIRLLDSKQLQVQTPYPGFASFYWSREDSQTEAH